MFKRSLYIFREEENLKQAKLELQRLENRHKNFFHEPDSPSRALLLDKMSSIYLFTLNYSFMLTQYLDVPAVFFPAWFVRWKVLFPQAKVAQGTVDGVCLAIKHSWAINLSGGYTHATHNWGSIFNIYPDINLAIHYAKKWHAIHAQRILYINTSTLQSDGVACEWKNDRNVYICDIYDPSIFPKDLVARDRIDSDIAVGYTDNNESYLSKVSHAVSMAISTFVPTFIIYNAGYDCISGDKKGNMSISDSVVILRDEIVFRACKELNNIPILMVVGGCYQPSQGTVISRSIRNLVVKFELSKKMLGIQAAQDYELTHKIGKKGIGRTHAGSTHVGTPGQRGSTFEGYYNMPQNVELGESEGEEDKYTDLYDRLKAKI